MLSSFKFESWSIKARLIRSLLGRIEDLIDVIVSIRHYKDVVKGILRHLEGSDSQDVT